VFVCVCVCVRACMCVHVGWAGGNYRAVIITNNMFSKISEV